MRKLHLVLALSIGALVFTSCKNEDKDPDPKDSFDQKGMLTNYAEHLIVPAYVAMEQSTGALHTAVEAFTADPTTSTLADCRTAWINALTQWQRTSLFQIGPASEMALRENVNTYPTDTATIESNIQNGTYDLELLSNYDAKGFQAMDYLLFGIGSNDSELLLAYTTDAHASARKQYLTDISNNVHQKIMSVTSTWQSTYATTFQQATGVDIGSSIGLMLNELNLYYERYIRDGKVGIPSGARTFSQTPLPDKAEAYFNNAISRDLLVTSMNTVRNVYLGNDEQGNEGIGFDDYLYFAKAQYASESLDETIQQQLALIITTSENLQQSIAEQSTSDQSSLLDLFDDMQFLSSLFKVEMASALDVQITYKDSDGD